jgi:vacuolar-type H+-ATPase subunit F/Vma7
MAKIAFIGKEKILRVFTYFGTTVFQVTTSQEAEEKLQELVDDQENEWGIIYIEEPLAEMFIDRITELNKNFLPVISLFPSTGEKKGLSGKILNNLVRKVTGVEIQFD